jgi:8-oxo-dGTP diphosphatase
MNDMKHIEVVGAIIIRNDKILCLQRNTHKYDYLSHKFEFPGGKIEANESKKAALRRELREELDLEIEIKNEFLKVIHSYPDFKITLHSYICEALQNEFILKEHISYKWLTFTDLKTLDWAEADLPIVAKLAEKGN